MTRLAPRSTPRLTAVDYVVIEAVGTANTSMKIQKIGTATIKILLFLVFPMAVPRVDNFTFHTEFVFCLFNALHCQKSAGKSITGQ